MKNTQLVFTFVSLLYSVCYTGDTNTSKELHRNTLDFVIRSQVLNLLQCVCVRCRWDDGRIGLGLKWLKGLRGLTVGLKMILRHLVVLKAGVLTRWCGSCRIKDGLIGLYIVV
jgi:hypothetical protein